MHLPYGIHHLPAQARYTLTLQIARVRILIIQGTVLVDIGNEDPEWGAVEEEMQSTIRFDIHVFFIIS